MPDGRTIVFFPEPGAWGPTNNCVAIAEVLKERGHRVVFVVDSSFEGVLEEKGYEERLMRMAPHEEGADPSDDPWAECKGASAAEVAVPFELFEDVARKVGMPPRREYRTDEPSPF